MNQDDESQAPLSCNPTLQELYDYLGGNLSESQRAQVQSHVVGCPGCDDVLHFHQGLISMIGSSCRSELPPEVRRRVLDSITKLF